MGEHHGLCLIPHKRSLGNLIESFAASRGALNGGAAGEVRRPAVIMPRWL
jgi:hypothetical protein